MEEDLLNQLLYKRHSAHYTFRTLHNMQKRSIFSTVPRGLHCMLQEPTLLHALFWCFWSSTLFSSLPVNLLVSIVIIMYISYKSFRAVNQWRTMREQADSLLRAIVASQEINLHIHHIHAYLGDYELLRQKPWSMTDPPVFEDTDAQLDRDHEMGRVAATLQAQLWNVFRIYPYNFGKCHDDPTHATCPYKPRESQPQSPCNITLQTTDEISRIMVRMRMRMNVLPMICEQDYELHIAPSVDLRTYFTRKVLTQIHSRHSLRTIMQHVA